MEFSACVRMRSFDQYVDKRSGIAIERIGAFLKRIPCCHASAAKTNHLVGGRLRSCMPRLLSQQTSRFTANHAGSSRGILRKLCEDNRRRQASASAFIRKILVQDLRLRLTCVRQRPLRLSMEAISHDSMRVSQTWTRWGHTQFGNTQKQQEPRENFGIQAQNPALGCPNIFNENSIA